jgi:DNA polymerase-1
MIKLLTKQIEHFKNRLSGANFFEKYSLNANIKTNMKQLFGKKKYLKDGKEGKTLEFPTILRMHSDTELINTWINYSGLDAEITFFVY